MSTDFAGTGSRRVFAERLLREVDRRITSSTVTIGLGPALAALPTYTPFTATDSVAVLTSGGLARRALGSTLRNYILTISGGTATIAENLTVGGTLTKTGTGTVTLAPTTAGTLNNIVIGGVTPLAGTFTTLAATGALSGQTLALSGTTTASLIFGLAGLGNDLVNLAVRRVVNSAGGGNFVGQKARGTVGAETFVNAFDNIAVFAGRAWDGTGYVGTTADITIRSFENQTALARGGIIDFNVTRLGTTILNTSMSLEANGTLVLYGDSVNAGLSTAWTGGSVASPVFPASGQSLGYFAALAWTGTGTMYANGASISYAATQTWTATARGTQILFNVAPNGSTAVATAWVIGNDGHLAPPAAQNNLLDVGRTTAGIRTYYVGTSILPVNTDAATIGVAGKGFQSMLVEHNASRADGLRLIQTLTGTASPRLYFNNTTDWAGAANVIYQTASNQLSFATGGTPGAGSGTARFNYDTGALFPQTTNAFALGKTAQVWSDVFATRVTAPLFGTTTAADVVFDRNSVTQLTLGSLTASWGLNASGSNSAASNYTHIAPLSTGNATPAALVWQVGVQGASSSTPQTATEGFRVQEIANESSRETTLWKAAGTMMAGLPLTALTTGLSAADSIRAANVSAVYATGANVPTFRGYKSNGTFAAPTQVLAFESAFNFQGFARTDASAYATIGLIYLQSRENITATTRGSQWVIEAADTGASATKQLLSLRGGGTNIAEMRSAQSTLRLIPGATQFAIRDSGNTADTLTINAAGTTVTIPLATTITAAASALSIGLGATINETGADSDTRIEGDTLTHAFLLDAGQDSIGLFGSAVPNFQTGKGIFHIANATTVPTGDPTGGGFLYAESGALKWRGSSGTTTLIAVA